MKILNISLTHPECLLLVGLKVTLDSQGEKSSSILMVAGVVTEVVLLVEKTQPKLTDQQLMQLVGLPNL